MGLPRMPFEETDHAWQRLGRKLMAAGMNVSHKLGTRHTGFSSHQAFHLRFRRIGLQQLSRKLDAVLLSLKRNERVFLAGDDEYGLRFRTRDQSAAGPRGGAQRGYFIAPHIPKQVHKPPAVRVTQDIDAIRISLVLLLREFERGIEELEVTIAE